MWRQVKSATVIFALSMSPLSCQCSDDAALDAGTPDASDTGSDSETDVQPSDPHVDWLTIHEGSFTFGSPDGTPCIKPLMEKIVPVTLTHPFLISKYEVTQKQWKALGLKIPPIDPICDDCPISFLNTNEAKAWCNALSRFEGLEECYDLSSCTGDIGGGCPDGDFYALGCMFNQGAKTTMADSIYIDGLYLCPNPVRRYASMYDCSGYRLPTGPEWEYAAKAGTTTNTYNGDITTASSSCIEEPILNDIAWYCFNSGAGDTDRQPDQIRGVGLKQPNPWGLYDVLGNAGEWVDYMSNGLSLDTNEGKPGEPLVDPMGATEDADARGDARGGWVFRHACTTRAASQFDDFREVRSSAYGFRPVRTLPATSADAGVK